MIKEQKEKIRKTLMGHLVSQETKNKISLKNKGRQAWNKGIAWSEEMKRRISETNKRKGIEPKIKFVGFGSEHPRWKGGKGTERHRLMGCVEYKLWRTAVFERDGYTCVWCGEQGVYVEADHIQEWSDRPELRYAIDNGRTLCLKCHKKRHGL